MYEPTAEELEMRRLTKYHEELGKCFTPDSLTIEWISVNDRLPVWTEDKMIEVLVCTPYAEYDNYCGIMVIPAMQFYDVDEDGNPKHPFLTDVTHWAKLPLLPI